MAKKSEEISRRNLDDPKFAKVRQLLHAAAHTKNGYASVANFFDDFSEADRREMAAFCLDWYDYLVHDSPAPFLVLPPLFPEGADIRSAFHATNISVVACCSFDEIVKVLAVTGAAYIHQQIEHVLRTRRPAWTAKILFSIVRLPQMENYFGWEYWKIYRHFLKENLIEPIEDEVWTRLMFGSMLADTLDGFGGHEAIALREQLRNAPELFEKEIWDLFELTQFPPGSSNLTSLEILFSPRYGRGRKGDDWKETIITFVKNGEMSKERVIDGCLRSLDRPFSDHESRWFVQLLEQIIDKLPVSDDELSSDSERYLNLLENSNPSARSLGLKILERLFKSGKISDQKIVERTVAILRDPAKSKAKKAVAILEKIAKRNPGLRKDIFLVLLEGLQHESVDIQQASLKVLDRYDALKDADIFDSVTKLRELLAPSVRKLLPSLEGKTEESEKTETSPIPVAADVRLEKMTPVQSFDELVELAAKLLERPEDINDIERLFDGLAKIGSIREPDFEKRTAPLLKRAMKLLRANTRIVDGTKVTLLNDYEPFAGQDIHADLKYLIIAWLTGMVPHIKRLDDPLEVKCNFHVMSERDSLYRFQAFIGTEVWYYNDSYFQSIPSILVFSARAKQVAEMLVAGESGQLLATPTHQGGWIDPTVFVKRLIDANNQEHDDHDRVLALLRLTVEGRMEALELLDKKLEERNEYIDAVRYALGAAISSVGKTPHFWIAAARCRTPLSDDTAVESVHAGFGPDAGTAATYRFKTDHVLYSTGNVLLVDRFPSPARQNIDLSLFPSVALHVSDAAPWSERMGLYPWTFHVWPQNPAPAMATSIDVHARNIDKNYDYGFRHAMTAIASQGTPFHPMAVTAIFSALATKSPLVHTVAMDTAIAVIADGRMTPDIAAKPIQELLSMNILTLKRWIKPLNIIAEESNRHAHFVHQVLENMVDSISQKEAGGFLEILYELGVSLNVQIKREECRHYLESFTGSGKAAKLAKKLLEL